MRLFLSVVVLGVLASAAAANADHLDPQERMRAADQKRAAAMLLRRYDLGDGYSVERTSGLEPHLTCSALDESDLVVTGRRRSPYWSRSYQIVGSTSVVYATRADAQAARRRGASRAGLDCIRDEYRNEFARQGENLNVSIRELTLPLISESRTAYRLTLSGAGGSPALYVDAVVLTHGRAQSALVFAGVVTPPQRAAEIRLAKIVAARMSKAMRGSS
jgi:hypothetical protein